MAEQLGAVCCSEVDSSVTHVVALDVGTDKARWAVKNKKFLLHPRWIEACNYRWQRLPEEDFPVLGSKEKGKEKVPEAVAGATRQADS
jgi:RNA polymerase II C-terminal domain phosphatase-like 3/4